MCWNQLWINGFCEKYSNIYTVVDNECKCALNNREFTGVYRYHSLTGQIYCLFEEKDGFTYKLEGRYSPSVNKPSRWVGKVKRPNMGF